MTSRVMNPSSAAGIAPQPGVHGCAAHCANAYPEPGQFPEYQNCLNQCQACGQFHSMASQYACLMDIQARHPTQPTRPSRPLATPTAMPAAVRKRLQRRNRNTLAVAGGGLTQACAPGYEQWCKDCEDYGGTVSVFGEVCIFPDGQIIAKPDTPPAPSGRGPTNVAEAPAAPSPRAQPRPTGLQGVRRTQMAMRGRLTNPRYGW